MSLDTQNLPTLNHLELGLPALNFKRPLQNCLHGRIALWRATRSLAYLFDMSSLLCCGRLALHPVRLLLQRSLQIIKTRLNHA